MRRSWIALLGLVGCGVAWGQFEVDRFRIAGGGGQSAAGEWSLTGTIGQADADVISLCSADGTSPGLCTGASIELVGGFWAGVAPPEPSETCLGDPDCVFRDGFEAVD